LPVKRLISESSHVPVACQWIFLDCIFEWLKPRRRDRAIYDNDIWKWTSDWWRISIAVVRSVNIIRGILVGWKEQGDWSCFSSDAIGQPCDGWWMDPDEISKSELHLPITGITSNTHGPQTASTASLSLPSPLPPPHLSVHQPKVYKENSLLLEPPAYLTAAAAKSLFS